MDDSPARQGERQEPEGAAAAARPLDGLLRLLGPAIDPAHLEADLRTNAEILSLLERLWDAPIDPLQPVPPFTPAWDDEP